MSAELQGFSGLSIANSPASPDSSIDPSDTISLVQEHILKRELVALEIDKEIARLDDFKNIGRFGSPFIDKKARSGSATTSSSRSKSKPLSKTPSNGDGFSATYADGYADFPVLRHMFVKCILKFPFISQADEIEFWQNKVQPFIESFADKDISTTADREEATKRRRMASKLKKLIFVYTTAGLQTTRPEERKVILASTSHRGVQQIDPKTAVSNTLVDKFVNGYSVSVIGVRSFKVRRGFIYERKWEYIIRAQMEGAPPMHVARTYKDFKELDHQLHRSFPGGGVPTLPSRNKSSVNVDKNNLGATSTTDNRSIDIDFDEDEDDVDEEYKNETRSSTDLLDTKRIVSKMFKLGSNSNNNSNVNNTAASAKKLHQEKQRITLRSYMKKLIEVPKVTKSSAFLEFLFKDRIRELSREEQEDIALRHKVDLQRIADQVRFFELAKKRARKLEHHLAEFKQELLQKDGLANIFGELKEKSRVEELSPKFQKFVEWALIGFSATLYSIFIAQDNSPEVFSQVRRIHSLMPYTLLRGVLRYSNPVAVMKGVTDLFLAQPFGKRSLMQNLLMVVLADDIRVKEKEIEALKGKMDKEIVITIEAYTNTEAHIREYVHAVCEERSTDVVIELFRLTNQLPDQLATISQSTVATVELWYKDWTLCKSGRANEATDIDNADRYSQIKSLIGLIVRKRDKDMMQEFWADGVTVQLLKELITVFYGPLIQVFKCANIHESVGDFGKFMDDLIKTVKRCEVTSVAMNDPNQTVQAFVDLCRRHQNSLFKFIHEVYSNDNGLFDGILHWMCGIMEFLRSGCKEPLDLIGMVERAHQQGIIKKDILSAELDLIQSWTQAVKKWREDVLYNEEVNWNEAVPVGVINGQDFGLSQADFDPDSDSDDDATRNMQKPLKPALSEVPKLLGAFHDMAEKILRKE